MDACNPGICLGKQYKVCEWVCSVRSISLWPCGLKPARLLCPWNFPGLEYQSRLPFPSPEGLPSPGMEPTSPVSPALAGRFFTAGATWEAMVQLSSLTWRRNFLLSLCLGSRPFSCPSRCLAFFLAMPRVLTDVTSAPRY